MCYLSSGSFVLFQNEFLALRIIFAKVIKDEKKRSVHPGPFRLSLLGGYRVAQLRKCIFIMIGPFPLCRVSADPPLNSGPSCSIGGAFAAG
jgi:hypothetical protein